jgi:hypothetical protein
MSGLRRTLGLTEACCKESSLIYQLKARKFNMKTILQMPTYLLIGLLLGWLVVTACGGSSGGGAIGGGNTGGGSDPNFINLTNGQAAKVAIGQMSLVLGTKY